MQLSKFTFKLILPINNHVQISKFSKLLTFAKSYSEVASLYWYRGVAIVVSNLMGTLGTVGRFRIVSSCFLYLCHFLCISLSYVLLLQFLYSCLVSVASWIGLLTISSPFVSFSDTRHTKFGMQDVIHAELDLYATDTFPTIQDSVCR